MASTPIQDQMIELAHSKGYIAHPLAEPGKMVLCLEKIDKEHNIAYTLNFMFWIEDLDNLELPVSSVDEVLALKFHSTKSYIRMKLIENLLCGEEDIEKLNNGYQQILADQAEFENIFTPKK